MRATYLWTHAKTFPYRGVCVFVCFELDNSFALSEQDNRFPLVSAGGAEELDKRTTEELKHTKITFPAVSPLLDLTIMLYVINLVLIQC